MQFTTIAASFLAAAGLSAASPVQARQTNTATTPSGDYIWKISDFTARKLNGKDIDSLSFNVKATNGGTLDFTCSSSNGVSANQFYQCGENSFIWFSYQDDRSGLLLRQDVSDDIQYVATATLPSYCRAGGSGPDDYVCQGVADAYITLVQYPGQLAAL